MSKGKKEAPKSRGTSRNLCADGKSSDPCRAGLVSKCLVCRHQGDNRYQQTTTGDIITSILGATGSQGLSEGQASLTKKATLTFCGDLMDLGW